MSRLSQPHIIKGGKEEVLHIFFNERRKLFFFLLTLTTEITNTWYDSHRHSNKQNGIKLNRVHWNEIPFQTEFLSVWELNAK